MLFLKCAYGIKKYQILGGLKTLCKLHTTNICFQSIVKTNMFEMISCSTNNKKRYEGVHSKSKYGFLCMFALPFFQNDEEKSELFLKIQDGLESIEKQDYLLAERQLHAAMKFARDEKNMNAVNYIFSILANMAYMIEDYNKAELLYVDLLQKLISLKMDYDSNAVMHISLKLAMIYGNTNQHEKALAGFEFCVETMKPLVDAGKANIDILTLYGMTQESFGNYLLRGSLFDEAQEKMKIALDICIEVKGPDDSQTAVLQNNLGKIALLKNNFEEASLYFEKAIKISEKLNESVLPIYLINLGRSYYIRNLFVAANDACSKARKRMKGIRDEEMKTQVDMCFKLVREAMK